METQGKRGWNSHMDRFDYYSPAEQTLYANLKDNGPSELIHLLILEKRHVTQLEAFADSQVAK